MRKCSDCKIIKSIDQFYKDSRRKIGIRYECKKCSSKKSLDYRLKNKDKMIQNSKKWKKENPEKLKIQRAKKFKRQKDNPLFILTSRLRKRLHSALKVKNFRKDSKFANYIGCSAKELKEYIESKFLDGMTWSNKDKWHIDHIIPLSSAKTQEDIYILSHYTNLQPLWAIDNLKKASKVYGAGQLK